MRKEHNLGKRASVRSARIFASARPHLTHNGGCGRRGNSRSTGYCTTTCSATLLLMLPEVAVIVTAYVPDGVPGVVWVDEPLPPHDAKDAKANNTMGAARTV